MNMTSDWVFIYSLFACFNCISNERDFSKGITGSCSVLPKTNKKRAKMAAWPQTRAAEHNSLIDLHTPNTYRHPTSIHMRDCAYFSVTHVCLTCVLFFSCFTFLCPSFQMWPSGSLVLWLQYFRFLSISLFICLFSQVLWWVAGQISGAWTRQRTAACLTHS